MTSFPEVVMYSTSIAMYSWQWPGTYKRFRSDS